MGWITRKLGEAFGLHSADFIAGLKEGFNHQMQKQELEQQIGERLDTAMRNRDVFLDAAQVDGACHPINEHITSVGTGLICEALENKNYDEAISFVDLFKTPKALPLCLTIVKQGIEFTKKEQCSKLIAGATMNLLGCPNPFL